MSVFINEEVEKEEILHIPYLYFLYKFHPISKVAFSKKCIKEIYFIFSNTDYNP